MQEKIEAYVWGVGLDVGGGVSQLSEIGRGLAVVRIRSGVLRPNGNDGGMGCGKAHVRV
jgi:hypothetical protein